MCRLRSVVRWQPKQIRVRHKLVAIVASVMFIMMCYTVELRPPDKSFIIGVTRVTRLNHGYLIKPKIVCEKEARPFSLVLITSIPSHQRKRNGIRTTWGSVAREGSWPGMSRHGIEMIKIVFMFGRTDEDDMSHILLDEAREYGDILQQDYVESYYNLTLKVLLGLTWMKDECSNARRVLKVDDDTFIHLPLLFKELSVLDDNTIYGFCYYYSFTLRYHAKYGVAYSDYPYIMYPPYCQGNMYVIPSGLAKYIHTVAGYYSIFPMEDVYITGLLPSAIRPKHVSVSSGMHDPANSPHRCDFVREAKVFGREVDALLAADIWQTLKDGKCT